MNISVRTLPPQPTSLSPMLSERGNVSNSFFVSKYVLEKVIMSTMIYYISLRFLGTGEALPHEVEHWVGDMDGLHSGHIVSDSGVHNLLP